MRRLVALLLLVACAAPPDETGIDEGGPERPPSIVLISIDTLRADRLGSYGNPRPTSPRLDALAAEGVRYAEALAPTPWTLPSHAAMLTGIHPWTLGVVNQWRSLPTEAPTLAEGLGAAGYRTAAFVDSIPRGFVGAERGFDRGFETFEHAPHGEPTDGRRYDVASTADAGLAWLDGLGPRASEGEPFFLFLHTRSVHAVPTDEPCRDRFCFPYDQPAPFRGRYLDSEPVEPWISADGAAEAQAYLWWLNERITEGELAPGDFPRHRLDELVALYDAGINYTDHHLGRFFDGLAERGLADGTVVIVTSDHGESFLDHDLFMHQEVYRETLRIPLIVRPPLAERTAVAGRVVEQPVALEDIAATLFTWAGIDASESVPPLLDRVENGIEVEGRPLPGLAGLPVAHPITANIDARRDFFAFYLFPEKFHYRAYGLRRGAHKLILDNLGKEDGGWNSELVLAEDEHRLLSTDGAKYRELRGALRQRSLTPPKAVAERGQHKDLALGRDLETLGYID